MDSVEIRTMERQETESIILQFPSCCDSLPQHFLLECAVEERALTPSPCSLESLARSTSSLNDASLMLSNHCMDNYGQSTCLKK